MKKKILYIAAILICLSIISGGTYAYYTSSDTARNVITSGDVEVVVVEQQSVDGSFQPYPPNPIPVMPTDEISKIVSAQSLRDTQAAWVRMNYTLNVYNAKKEKLDIPADELAKAIIIEPKGSKWTMKDGWWYYTDAIKDGEVTEPLFESVKFSGPEMDNRYQLCTVVIDVSVQAVQKAHNGSTVMDAQGWPES